jgi:hypothetical protein
MLGGEVSLFWSRIIHVKTYVGLVLKLLYQVAELLTNDRRQQTNNDQINK